MEKTKGKDLPSDADYEPIIAVPTAKYVETSI